MSWPNFIEKGKISFRFLLPIAIGCGCFLFLPEEWKTKLAINKISNDYSQYIGIIFIITLVLISVEIVIAIFNSIGSWNSNRKVKGYVIDFIQSLSHDEKALIREFYLVNRNTMYLPLNNPTVLGLVSKRILIQIGNTGDMVNYQACFSYSITDIAKKYLTNSTIDFPIEVTTEGEDFLRQNRFQW